MRFKKFEDYLWYLLPSPLKRKQPKESEVFKLWKALGKVLDRIKQDIFKIRQQANIMTAEGVALEQHGKDRKLKKYSNESDEQYRNRLIAKKEIAEMAGTNEGIKATLRGLGYGNVHIEPMHLHFPERWAEFVVYLDKATLNRLNNFDNLQKEVKSVKQASSFPNYALSHAEEIEVTRKVYGAKFDNERYCGDFFAGEM